MGSYSNTFDDFENVVNGYDNNSEHPQHQTAEIQDGDWVSKMLLRDLEDAASGTNLDFLDFTTTAQAGTGTMTTMAGLPYRTPLSGSSSGNSLSTITPPESATHPVCFFPMSNTPAASVPLATINGQPWRATQNHPHAYVGDFGQEGLGIRLATKPQFDGIQQYASQHETLYQEPQDDFSRADLQSSDYFQNGSSERLNACLDETQGSDGDDEADGPGLCYAKLLEECLRSAPDRTMSLKEIYEWIEQNTNKANESKAKDPTNKGWQNSVRHNLSMNQVRDNEPYFNHRDLFADTAQGFQKATPSASHGAKKGSLWRLTDHAFRTGIISTTRYRREPKRRHDRKGAPAAPNRQQSGAKGGQVTRAKTRRNREMHQATSVPHSSPYDHRLHQHQRHDSPYASSFYHSNASSPTSGMMPMPDSASPFFFRQDHVGAFGQLPCNAATPPQLLLPCDMSAEHGFGKSEFQYLPHDELIANHDADHFADETPSLTTDTPIMSDDALESLMSPIPCQETKLSSPY